MSAPYCMNCKNKKHFGFSRDSLQFYCGMGANPTARGENDGVLWIPCHWSRILDKMIPDVKTSPKWCPLRERQIKSAKRAKRYFEDGTPKYVTCWEYKKQKRQGECFTVTFQHAGKTDKLTPGYLTGIGMGVDPEGISARFELAGQAAKASFGTRISFKDLPPLCQNLIKREYDYIWDLN